MAAGVLDSLRVRQNSFDRPLSYSQEAEEEVVSVRCVRLPRLAGWPVSCLSMQLVHRAFEL